MEEDSSWADVVVNYEEMADRLGSDLRWIRAQVEDVSRGRVQLRWPLSLSDEGSYRLETTLSAPAGGRVTLRIIEAQPPFKILWEQIVPLSGARETHRFDFLLPKLTEPAGLIWSVDQPGAYDLYSMRLVRRSPEEMQAERAARIAGASANQAPNSGFSLGLPAAWGVGRQSSMDTDVSFSPADDSSERGTVPLFIQPQRDGVRWELYSAPFQVADPDSLHVLSFWIRGDATGKVRILCDGEEYGVGSFAADSDFTLVRVPFRVNPMARWIVVAWTGTGKLELDALAVTMGRQAIPFTLPGEAEVALAADYDRANVFIQGIDQPELQFALTGNYEGTVLQSRITNFYGQSTQTTVSQDLASGSFIPTSPDPDRPLGSFRVEAWLERDGNRVSPISEVVYHFVPQPVYWGQIAPESRFGNHFHPYKPHLYGAKAIGVNWNRFHGGNAGNATYWSAVEPNKGDWRWHHERLAQYRESDFALCGVWVRVPNWARIQRAERGMDGWLDNWWQPRSLSEFAEYVRQSVRAYANQIDAWQIWNEPWGEFWFKEWRPELQGADRWHQGDSPDADFLELSRVAWEAAQAAGWDGPVLGIGATFGERGKGWMRRMLNLGAENFSNTLSFHAYFGGDLMQGINPNSGTLIRLQNRIFRPLEDHPQAAEMPIWMTEGGWLLRRPDTGLHKHSVPGPHDPLDVVRENAVKQPLYHAIMLSKGVDKIFSYALNGGYRYYRPVPQGQINWGSLVTPSGELHPHATAYAAMALRFEDAQFLRREQIDEQTVAFVFQTSTGQKFMALFGTDLTPYLDQLNESAVDFLGNPIRPDIIHQLIYAEISEGMLIQEIVSEE